MKKNNFLTAVIFLVGLFCGYLLGLPKSTQLNYKQFDGINENTRSYFIGEKVVSLALLNVDPKTFLFVDNVNGDGTIEKNHPLLDSSDRAYTKDSHHIYLGSEIISTDPASFICFPGQGFITEWCGDKEHVYFNGKIIPTNRDAFKVIVQRSEKDCGHDTYAGNNREVYYNGVLILGADPATFKVLGGGESKDKNAVYDGVYKTNKDPKTFMGSCLERRQ